jgi:hypothetical protein
MVVMRGLYQALCLKLGMLHCDQAKLSTTNFISMDILQAAFNFGWHMPC